MEKRMGREIQNIPIGQLCPHPDNPRKDVGDVEELAKSIRINGLMQNLTVIPKNPDKPVTPESDLKRDDAEKELLKLLRQFGVEKAPKDFSPHAANVVTVKEFNLDGKLPKKSFAWDRYPPKDAKLMYYRAYGGTVKIVYRDKPQKAEKTPQETKMERIARNRKEIKAMLKGFAADRRNFVIDVANGKCGKSEDSDATIKECYDFLLQTRTSIGYNELAGYLSGRFYWNLTEDEQKDARQQAKKLSMEHSLLMLADGRIGGETTLTDEGGHFKDKGEGYSGSLFYLRKLLGILSRYGFRVESEDVAGLLDGTSKLYEPQEAKA